MDPQAGEVSEKVTTVHKTVEIKKEAITLKHGWVSSLNSWDAKSPRGDARLRQSPGEKSPDKDRQVDDASSPAKLNPPLSLAAWQSSSPRTSPNSPQPTTAEDPRANAYPISIRVSDICEGASPCSTPAAMTPRSHSPPRSTVTFPLPAFAPGGCASGGMADGSTHRLLLQAFEEQSKEVYPNEIDWGDGLFTLGVPVSLHL